MMASNAPMAPSTDPLTADSSSIAASTRYVVAIDFGTSHSGFAYSHKSDDKKVEAFYQWKGAPVPYAKTLTSLLYDSNKKPVSWGYEAQIALSRMKPADRANACYEDRFKLLLDEEWNKNNPDLCRGRNAVSLIGDYLKFMKDHIIQTMTTKYGSQFSLNEVKWCLTVPAMWSDRAKFLTRKAAAYAQLIDDPTDSRLSILLEPEVAAIYIASENKSNLSNDDVFMILDAGGGTIDLTVYQIHFADGSESFSFTEVVPGLGRSCGSTFVDDQFLQFLEKSIGTKAAAALKNSPADMLAIKKSWESTKRQYNGQTKDHEVDSIPLPNKVLSSMSKEDQKRLFDEQGDEYDDCLLIPDATMRGFFKHVFDEIDVIVDKVLAACGNVKVKKIMCVGGFSESMFLIDHVRSRYEALGIEVYCPPSPGSAVVKGAAYFGLNPGVVAARRMRQTYGLAVRGYWDASFPDSKRTWDHYQRTWMVEDKFDILVNFGDAVDVEKQVKRVYYPPAIWSTSIKLSLYATSEPRPMFVDEPGCEALGEICVPLTLDKNKSINDYPISIFVQFGTSEINVKARDDKTGQIYHCTLSYLSKKPELPAVAAASSSPAGSSKRTRSPSVVDSDTNGKRRK